MKRAASRSEVGDLSPTQFAEHLKTGLAVRLGPFPTRIIATPAILATPLFHLYRYYELLAKQEVCSVHVHLEEKRVFPNFLRKSVRLTVDGQAPHEDMPFTHALPVLEWGINLVTALRSHCFLMLHAAAVELNGGAMLMPAGPGAGKSTLCAALSLRGWRLLSDEFGLIRPGCHSLIPNPRPVALKNESISLIRDFSSDAFVGPEIPGTRKGTVAHFRPPSDSIRASSISAPVNRIVFPQWRPDVSSRFTEIPKAEAFMMLASNAFNYELVGEPAFATLTGVVDRASCYLFEYSDLENATAALTDIARRDET